MKYIFIAYIFSVINIHILHYKLSQTSNSLTEKSQSGHSLRDGGSIPFLDIPVKYLFFSSISLTQFVNLKKRIESSSN
jgi:hypothetical protein